MYSVGKCKDLLEINERSSFYPFFPLECMFGGKTDEREREMVMKFTIPLLSFSILTFPFNHVKEFDDSVTYIRKKNFHRPVKRVDLMETTNFLPYCILYKQLVILHEFSYC